ncbi:MAG: ribonuclease H-like domain-containing protein [Polyangiaceae bacterium]
MSSLFSKLARLPSQGAAPGASSVVAEGADPQGKLAELRAKMDAMLGTTSAPPRRKDVAVNPDTWDLPIVREETSHGDCFIRRQVLGHTHAVGLAPIAPGFDARAEVLSLLALDPELAGCDPRRALYFDTETTGLSGGTGTVAFLLGLGFYDERGAFVLEQYFLPELGGETPILGRLLERLQNATMLVSFNGKSFDWPLLRTRLTLARLAQPAEMPPHLDLVHVARRIHRSKIGPRKSLRLQDLERELLALERVGDVPSNEISACYFHFLRTGDTSVMRAVIDHNATDVLSMAALVGLYGEPFDRMRLSSAGLAGVAHTLARAKKYDVADAVATRAVAEGGSAESYYARAEVARARGARDQALLDFEELARAVDVPKVRLALAKLYEHHVGDCERALALTLEGTGERPAAAEKRRQRLHQKVRKNAVVSGDADCPRLPEPE